MRSCWKTVKHKISIFIYLFFFIIRGSLTTKKESSLILLATHLTEQRRQPWGRGTRPGIRETVRKKNSCLFQQRSFRRTWTQPKALHSPGAAPANDTTGRCRPRAAVTVTCTSPPRPPANQVHLAPLSALRASSMAACRFPLYPLTVH